LSATKLGTEAQKEWKNICSIRTDWKRSRVVTVSRKEKRKGGVRLCLLIEKVKEGKESLLSGAVRIHSATLQRKDSGGREELGNKNKTSERVLL